MLCDHNLWLALVMAPHEHHVAAVALWQAQSDSESLLFCRSTQQGFLRLLTTEAVFRPYGLWPRTMNQAWDIYHRLGKDGRVAYRDEPAGLAAVWERLTSGNDARPKMWMDAYLAAFAIVDEREL